jgi:FkbM family methyltransferase
MGSALLCPVVRPKVETRQPRDMEKSISMASAPRTTAFADVTLPSGMVVASLQKHEVPILNREVQGYFAKNLKFRPGDTVFDVGANIGLFGLAAYERCEHDIRLYAFEPVKEIFDVLRVNMERHGIGEQFQIFDFGLSSHAENTTFAYYPEAPNLSTAYPLERADMALMETAVLDNIMHLAEAPLALRCLRFLPRALRAPIIHLALGRALRPQSVICRMQTFSQFIADHAIERVDLLKIDAEKAELEIFHGIEAADWPKIQQVVVEVHDQDGRLAAITALLREHGLSEIIVDQPPTLINSNIHDVFAIRPQ